MATNTKVHVTRARYGGYVATFAWNGDDCRVFFDDSFDLAQELVDACVDDVTRDAVLDAYELHDWNSSPYPLFQPAEAACCEPVDDPPCNCELCRSFPRSYVESVNSRFYKGVLCVLCVCVAWLLFKRNG